MNYGYDSKTKCLFSWDGEFHYEGKVDTAPADAFLVEEEFRPWLEMAGCHFLSGHRRNCVFYLSAGENSCAAYGDMLHANCKWTDCHDWKQVIKHVHPNTLLCVAGYVANDPVAIAELCRTHPCNTVYVCPLVEELAAFGVLAVNLLDKEKPRRTSLCITNNQDMEGQYLEYDHKLDGDGYGKMADVVHRGFAVLNEMMDCPGISPFYGRVLANKSGLPPVFIIRSDSIGRYFPHEPLSTTHYAATSVPVEVENTRSFMEQSKCNAPKVNIVVSSDYIPGLPVFMNFYKVMSGNDCVGTTCPKQLASSKKVPVFRYNKAYKMEFSKSGRI